ncbi:hypothetical protein KFK09_006989 [Dendrobium nobile]|uniref:Uncharacterized protein n=1 Tax=Dendrobium nobile TaxID=94219 RepID=A0A8T3BSU7_DENNO|nr:hypothetical protein KFK09_006989 [Dendrobium nobile]
MQESEQEQGVTPEFGRPEGSTPEQEVAGEIGQRLEAKNGVRSGRGKSSENPFLPFPSVSSRLYVRKRANEWERCFLSLEYVGDSIVVSDRVCRWKSRCEVGPMEAIVSFGA